MCIHKATFDVVVVVLVSWKAQKERQVNYDDIHVVHVVVVMVVVDEVDVDAVVEDVIVVVVVDYDNLKERERKNERQGIQD